MTSPKDPMQLSVSDVAELLGVSGKTVYRWVKDGRLPAYRLGQQLRFNRSELLEWATAQRVAVAPQGFEALDTGGLPVRFSQALRAGGINYRVGGGDKREALRAAVETLRLPDHVAREVLLAVLLARESLGSTGIGGGIAIPHPRNPIVLQLSRPAVTLCFLENPVEFGAVDGAPVDKLFVITSPTVRAHLSLLSQLSWLLRKPTVRKVLEDPASREVILEEFARREAEIPALVGALSE
jgi:PTS system nitrogen regulatory IIA component